MRPIMVLSAVPGVLALYKIDCQCDCGQVGNREKWKGKGFGKKQLFLKSSVCVYASSLSH